MQRNLSGICFLVAAVCIGLAVGTWWLKFSTLSPNDTAGAAHAVLADDEIRAEVTTVVSVAAAGIIEADTGALATFIDQIVSTRAGAAVSAELVRDGHARAIGAIDDPVRISGEQMVQIVRDQRAATLEPVTLPVPRIAVFNALRVSVGWIALGLLVIGVLAVLAGLVLRPERIDVVRGFAELLLATGTSLVVIGYLLPVFVLPALNDTTWSAVVSRLALRTSALVIIASAVFVGLGGLLWLGNRGSSGRRSAWGGPSGPTRYQQERRWSSPGSRIG